MSFDLRKFLGLKPKSKRKSFNERLDAALDYLEHRAIPDQQFSYGRANRPQTPVDGIIRNDFGEESVNHLQQKYAAWKQMQNSTRGLTGIRMTNAQIAADNAIKAKLQTSNPAGAEVKKEFKLKRFQNIDPKTSTKRTGDFFCGVGGEVERSGSSSLHHQQHKKMLGGSCELAKKRKEALASRSVEGLEAKSCARRFPGFGCLQVNNS